jgi:hypothetical protein
MTNLQQSSLNISNLKKAQDIKGKIKEFLTTEQMEQLAAESRIPHYVLTNPVTNETVYCFNSAEINEWLSNYLVYNPCKIEQSLNFLKFDITHHKAPKEDSVPLELSLIKNLYKLPLENISTPPGIYFLCQQGKIVYVGQSVNVAQRIVTHMTEKQKEFDEIYFIPCHPNNLNTFEAALIRFFAPKYNARFLGSTDEDREVFKRVCEQNIFNDIKAA